MKLGGITTGTSAAVGQFFKMYALTSLWVLINGLQFIVFFPLLRNTLPGNVMLVSSILIKLATFEVIDGDFIKEKLYGL